MTDYKDQILNYIAQERDTLKKLTNPIRFNRNQMYENMRTTEWDEINLAYEDAMLLFLYDYLSDKLDLPVDELYCNLEEIELSKIFEPTN